MQHFIQPRIFIQPKNFIQPKREKIFFRPVLFRYLSCITSGHLAWKHQNTTSRTFFNTRGGGGIKKLRFFSLSFLDFFGLFSDFFRLFLLTLDFVSNIFTNLQKFIFLEWSHSARKLVWGRSLLGQNFFDRKLPGLGIF